MVAMRLNENMIRCPGCKTAVNPYVVFTVGAQQNKKVECPLCANVFEIRYARELEPMRWVVHSQSSA